MEGIFFHDYYRVIFQNRKLAILIKEADIWWGKFEVGTETVIVYPEITLFLMEEVLFFQFFEKMRPFRKKFVMTKFEEHKISFLFICVRPYKKVPCCRSGVKARGSN